MTFNPIKMSHKHCYTGTIPNKLTHYNAKCV